MQYVNGTYDDVGCTKNIYLLLAVARHFWHGLSQKKLSVGFTINILPSVHKSQVCSNVKRIMGCTKHLLVT